MSEATSPIGATAPPTFSPGQWVALRGHYDGINQSWWNVTVLRGEPRHEHQQNLCMVFGVEGHAEANATLMAAGPELLAAAKRLLKYAVDLNGSYHVHHSEIETLRAAIAKAVPR